MSLASGTRLGTYEVVEMIGAGGMGEVYRARDTKLQRDVAIKVLSDQVAGDRDRLSRFEREAQVLASLNHPHIGHIYGLEEIPSTGSGQAGGAALILELIEGPTLADRIAQGPIPIAEALPLARQIAEAVEAAHELNIIHRDLKPANIKVRDDGTVKVLDFGLAKALDPVAASGSAVMNSPTLTAHATQMGVILGTAAYMAPEQARGKPVDRRADVWAFGVVVYEMLTGRRAFDGDEVSDVLAAVLKETPPLDALPADTPPAIRRLLRRCLEKDRRERLADMSAARLDIKDALAGDSVPPAVTAPAPQRRRASPAMWAGAAGLVLVAGVAGWLLKPAPVPGAPVARFSVALSSSSILTRSGRRTIAISPDGTHVAYAADSKLFLRKVDSFEAVALSSVSNPTSIFFGPDNAWIGFFADTKLEKVAITGGSAVPLCPAELPTGASWSGETIVFSQEKGIYRVAADGGTPELIVTRDGKESLTSPQLLPGGESILYTKGSGGFWNDAEVVIEDLKTHARATVMRGGFDARYVDGGYLVYGRLNEILAVPVDLAAGKVTGTPVSLVSGVATNTGAVVGVGQFDVSATGALVYFSGASQDNVQLVWAGLDGGETPIVPETGSYSYPRVSPDGSLIAFIESVGGNADVYVLEWARKSKTRVTRDPGSETSPIWSPDSKRLAYSSPKDGGASNVFVRSADGTGAEERLTTSTRLQVPFSWSKDNTLFIVEQRTDLGTSNDIFALPMTGDRKLVPLVTSPFDDRRPAISPDGRWLAYGSNELGPSEIRVVPYPDVSKSRYQVSAGGGTSPLWSTDGKAIYYRQGTKIMRVDVTTTPDFKPGKPVEVRSAPAEQSTMNYSLAPDGKRFVMVKPSVENAAPEYRVVLNWIEEVKARVVAKK